MKVAVIKWLDCIGGGGWTEFSKVMKNPMTVTSVGIVINKNKKGITISSDVARDQCNDPIFIPHCCIKKIKYYKLKGLELL